MRRVPRILLCQHCVNKTSTAGAFHYQGRDTSELSYCSQYRGQSNLRGSAMRGLGDFQRFDQGCLQARRRQYYNALPDSRVPRTQGRKVGQQDAHFGKGLEGMVGKSVSENRAGDVYLAANVRFREQSGHALLRCTCLLMTQSDMRKGVLALIQFKAPAGLIFHSLRLFAAVPNWPSW